MHMHVQAMTTERCHGSGNSKKSTDLTSISTVFIPVVMDRTAGFLERTTNFRTTNRPSSG